MSLTTYLNNRFHLRILYKLLLLFITSFQLHAIYVNIFCLFLLPSYVIYVDYNNIIVYIINNKNKKLKLKKQIMAVTFPKLIGDIIPQIQEASWTQAGKFQRTAT